MQVNIHEAKTQLSHLIQCVLNGEEVIIARNNQPVVRLQALTKRPAKRKLGSLHGLVKYIAVDFDAPLDDFQEYMV
jgi:prevent-host-death family protein